MSRNYFAPIAIGALAIASSARASEELHLFTRRAAYLHVQYTSKAEFIQGLKTHPRALHALAKHFQVSTSTFLDYVSSSLHLGKLHHSGTFRVWGLADNGSQFAAKHRFEKGMPVWETPEGKPVLRWLCANPMTSTLPMVAAMPTPPNPPPPSPPTPPVAPPAPPTPPPAPTEPPAPPTPPVPPTPPPVEPPVTPPPPPPPVVTPVPTPPMPKPAPMMESEGKGLPFLIWFGVTDWQLFEISRIDTYFTLGASYDPIKVAHDHIELGIYGDTAGWMDQHPSYKYYGGGVEARGYLFSNLHTHSCLNPYASAGYGLYYTQIMQATYESHLILAPRFTAGFDICKRFVIEGSYTAFGNHFGRDLGRFGVEAGYRF